jgi:hypothetical protein
MRESTRPARERIITMEVLKLERRQALERSRRTAAEQDLAVREGLRWAGGRDAPR